MCVMGVLVEVIVVEAMMGVMIVSWSGVQCKLLLVVLECRVNSVIGFELMIEVLDQSSKNEEERPNIYTSDAYTQLRDLVPSHIILTDRQGAFSHIVQLTQPIPNLGSTPSSSRAHPPTPVSRRPDGDRVSQRGQTHAISASILGLDRERALLGNGFTYPDCRD
jgi:hypothetical protein